MRRKFTLPVVGAVAAAAVIGMGAVASQAAVIPASELAPYSGTGNAPFLYHLNGTHADGSAGYIANYGTFGSAGNLTNLSPAETFIPSGINSSFGNEQYGADTIGNDTAKVQLTDMTDANGSFTAEAIFQMPSSTPSSTQFNIVSYGGNEGSTAGSFGEWYISYNDARMQFIINNRVMSSTGSFSRDTILNNLPNVTLTAGDYYAVAMSWDNVSGAANEYLTQLTGAGADNTGQALLLGTANGDGTLMSLSPTTNSFLAVGAAAHVDGGNGFSGSPAAIDEVRIQSGVHDNFTDLQPVPEPASLGLFAVGGMGLLLLGKRRKTV